MDADCSLLATSVQLKRLHTSVRRAISARGREKYQYGSAFWHNIVKTPLNSAHRIPYCAAAFNAFAAVEFRNHFCSE